MKLARLKSKTTGAVRIVRENGLPGLAFVVGRVVLHPPMGRVEWFAILETEHDPSFPRLSPTWITDPADAAYLATLHGHPDDHAERLAHGVRCAALTNGSDRLIAYLWIASGDHWNENGVELSLDTDEVWAVDGFVAKESRGEAIHSRLFMGVMDELHEGGVTTVVSGVDLVNTKSLRSAAKRGARRSATVMMVRVGPYALSCLRYADEHWRRRWGFGSVPVRVRR